MTPRDRWPELPPPRPSRLPPVQQHRLANGLDIFIVEQHVLPVIDVRLVVRAGAAQDNPALAGCAYLVSDMLDEGTATRSAPEIADAAELLGASMLTRASWDSIAAVLHVLEPRLLPALELLADIVIAPAFEAAEFERVRAERLAAILQERADPHTLASHTFSRVLYGPRTPYGHPIGGRAETVSRVTAEDVRNFHAQHFVPENAFLVVVGDVRAGKLLPRLEALFGGWHGAAAELRQPDGGAAAAERSIHIVHRPDAPQSELRIGQAGPPRLTNDYFPLHVGNTVLGGAFTSRLNMLLREEKAYTYGAGSGFAFRRHGGPFVASTAVATAATADAVACTVQEVARLLREPVPEEELARAKNYIVLGLPRTFETTGDVAEHVAEVALYDLGWDYFDRYTAEIAAVTADAVQGAVQRWLRPEALTIVVAGDADSVGSELETTGLGAVHVREEG